MKEQIMPRYSPWGAIQETQILAPGIFAVSTASHGGIYIATQERRNKLPHWCRKKWFEEDVEWAIPWIVFKDELDPEGKHLEQARSALRNSTPDAFEKLTGEEIQPGESRKRDEDTFLAEHAQDLLVISAVSISGTAVKCTATVGGVRDFENARTFIVHRDEYDTRQFNFVIDPKRHPEVEE
jgi:hypothetical protein